MPTETPKLILIPGLGADERIFVPQRQAFPELWIPPWIPPHNDESLADYAARMAEIFPPSLQQTGEPFILGGMSMGGMMAYEIARHIKPQAVILIASCRTPQGVNGFLRAARRLWPVVPATGAFNAAKFLSVPALRMFGKLTPEQQQDCANMFSEMDPQFMHWAVSAVLNWKPIPLTETPVYQIHGAWDQIIPLKSVTPDEIITDGGHLINLTHADAVNEFIRSVMAKT
jgi:pimeloyl-ACP methyl ester carboxylesterase